MKQLFFSAILLLFSISIFAQGTPVSEIRIASDAVVFGVNIPVGTKVYNVATKEIWVCTVATAATEKLSTVVSNFTLLNPAEQTISAAGNTVTLTNNAVINGVAGSTSSFSVAGAGSAHVATAGNTITITGTETQVLDYTSDPAKGTVTISGGNGSPDDVILPLADATNAGLLKPADYTKLNNIDPTAIVGTFTTNHFEVDAGHAASGTYILSPLPKSASAASSVLVSYNGLELNPANAQFTVTIATGTIQFDLAKLPLALYDAITVSYLKP